MLIHIQIQKILKNPKTKVNFWHYFFFGGGGGVVFFMSDLNMIITFK
jgi:hypothetical protein